MLFPGSKMLMLGYSCVGYSFITIIYLCSALKITGSITLFKTHCSITQPAKLIIKICIQWSGIKNMIKLRYTRSRIKFFGKLYCYSGIINHFFHYSAIALYRNAGVRMAMVIIIVSKPYRNAL